ncbi:helix-turn-helix domain-containing protein [Halopseudomonas pelagia]|uniref:helix-turn-helix domain-containing protein n=1 Tax=Halopseudomonas pelagia TaxID=553151 RepID=UPI00039C8FE7|nr:helix-turn-helix transcriptional regulator [Halopseudomonas pelagia]
MKEDTQVALARSIGEVIAHRRSLAGLTQEEVAEKLGLGNEAVSRLERGKATLSVVRLLELAEVFGCEAADLLTESSVRVDDQARQLQQLLTRLNSDDRALVVGVVRQLSERLAC